MHTFVCAVGLPYRLILVCDHDIICVYICLYKCTNEIYILSTNAIPTWDQYILWLGLGLCTLMKKLCTSILNGNKQYA